jgi:hypothetical protein
MHLPVRTIIVNQHAHDVAVQNLSKRIAARDDVAVVPVAGLYFADVGTTWLSPMLSPNRGHFEPGSSL